MKTLYESILKSTGSGKWNGVFNFTTTKPYTLEDENIEKTIIEDFCKFYKITDNGAKKDISTAIDTAKYYFENYGFEVVFDKDAVEKLQYWLDKGKIKFEHDLDYAPTLYKADGISLIIKTTVENRSYWWIWHCGSKRDLFSHANKWVMIFKK